MAIVSKEDLLSRLTAIIGEDQNDDAITLVEDMTDTFNDFDSKTKDGTNWKQKYEDNDKAWRQKYIDRFNKGVVEEPEDEPEEEHEAPKRFEELFSVKEN